MHTWGDDASLMEHADLLHFRRDSAHVAFVLEDEAGQHGTQQQQRLREQTPAGSTANSSANSSRQPSEAQSSNFTASASSIIMATAAAAKSTRQVSSASPASVGGARRSPSPSAVPETLQRSRRARSSKPKLGTTASHSSPGGDHRGESYSGWHEEREVCP